MKTSEFEDETGKTPPHVVEEAKNSNNCLLPTSSKSRYKKIYNAFIKWKQLKRIPSNSFSRRTLLAYYCELSKSKKSSTLWSLLFYAYKYNYTKTKYSHHNIYRTITIFKTPIKRSY